MIKQRIFRIKAIAFKEFLHIIHDPRSLLIIFVMPVAQLIMFGFALNMEIQNIDLAVLDFSKSPASRELIQQFAGSKYFNLVEYKGKLSEIEKLFLTRKARAILIVNKDFAQNFQTQHQAPIQILIEMFWKGYDLERTLYTLSPAVHQPPLYGSCYQSGQVNEAK